MSVHFETKAEDWVGERSGSLVLFLLLRELCWLMVSKIPFASVGVLKRNLGWDSTGAFC